MLGWRRHTRARPRALMRSLARIVQGWLIETHGGCQISRSVLGVCGSALLLSAKPRVVYGSEELLYESVELRVLNMQRVEHRFGPFWFQARHGARNLHGQPGLESDAQIRRHPLVDLLRSYAITVCW